MKLEEARVIADEALRIIVTNQKASELKDFLAWELDLTDEALDEAVEALSREPDKLTKPEEITEWPMWTLSIEDIKGVAKERGISFIGKDFDEIARITRKGIEAALCDVWEIAIEGGLRNTKAEWQFNIVDIGLSDTSEFYSDKEQSLTEKWIGEIGCEADRESLVFAFELVHEERTEDGSKNDVKITSIRHPEFDETEWDDICFAMERFILNAYKTTDWRQSDL